MILNNNNIIGDILCGMIHYLKIVRRSIKKYFLLWKKESATFMINKKNWCYCIYFEFLLMSRNSIWNLKTKLILNINANLYELHHMLQLWAYDTLYLFTTHKSVVINNYIWTIRVPGFWMESSNSRDISHWLCQ